MTMWTPELKKNLPRYRALADAIAEDVRLGRLSTGDQLPTHRDLADALGLTVGTVSRGYAEAERRGLTTGEVGRGTYVRGSNSINPWPDHVTDEGVCDLSLSLPVRVPEESALLADTLREVSEAPWVGELLTYRSDSANRRQRQIVAEWLKRQDIKAEGDRVLVTTGSQHGLNVVLSAIFRPGEVLLTEALTYPSIKSQARAYGVRLRGVAMDDEGMCPEALARACALEPRPAGLYLVPTLQNPTSAIQSVGRREALIGVAREHNLWIVEDDVHSALLEDVPPSLAALAPERTIYLASVAKCLAPGLRTGFLVAPPVLQARLLNGIHNSVWMPPPLMVEVTTRWLHDGTADHLIALKRAEIRVRQQLAARYLGQHQPKCHPMGYQLWLTLPDPWHTVEFVTQAQQEKVIVVGAGSFAISRHQVPQAVRLALGIPSRARLEEGLQALERLLATESSAIC